MNGGRGGRTDDYTKDGRDRPTEILLVEDNPDDVALTVEALKKARIRNTINVVGDGVEALEFLDRQGRYRSAPFPDIILLDLHLPKLSGQELLMEIKKNSVLRGIPVCVMTASRSEQETIDTESLGVACSLVKPVDPEDFSRIVGSLEGSRGPCDDRAR